jgi:uncharacterized protein (DUF2141 family)
VRRALACVPLLLLVGAAPVGSSAPIEVRVSDIRSGKGLVRVAICGEAEFMKRCRFRASAPAVAGSMAFTVADVPPGRYAVQAFHDEDGDGKVTAAWFHIPKEGVGFSNDAMPRLMKPRFAKAAFDHADGGQRVPVKLRYFLG